MRGRSHRLTPAQALFLELLHTPTTHVPTQAAKVGSHTLANMTPGAWKDLWRLAGRSGLPGYLLAVLDEAGRIHGTRIPAALRRNLEGHRSSAIYSYLVNRKVYDDIAAAFTSASIPHTPLKGIKLVDELYPDPGWRALGDIDLLVPPGALDAAHDALLALGFTPETDAARERQALFHHHHGYARTVGAEHVRLELHFKLGAWLPGSLELAVAPHDAHGSPRRFDPIDELFYLMLHAAHHLYRTSPKWQVDIHLAARALAASPTQDGSAWDGLGPVYRRMEQAASSARLLNTFLLARAMQESWLTLRIPALPASRPAMATLEALCRPDELLDLDPIFARKWPYYALAVLVQDDPVAAAAAAARSIRFKAHLERTGA